MYVCIYSNIKIFKYFIDIYWLQFWLISSSGFLTFWSWTLKLYLFEICSFSFDFTEIFVKFSDCFSIGKKLNS